MADTFTFWGWLIFAFVLFGFELLAPLTYFLWLGVSALVTAAVSFFAPDLAWQAQCLVFSVLAVCSILLSRKYLVKRQTSSEVPNLNRRAQQYIGRVFTLVESSENGKGKIRVDDSLWTVTGPVLPQGTEVRVVAVEGAVFQIEQVNP